MAYRQPRVPEYNEREGEGKTLRALILFLKDFSMAAWTANNQRKREIEAVWQGMPETPEIVYPVTDVNGKTGNVTLDAQDVGALGRNETAADAAKIDGKTISEVMLSVYPVGSVYMSFEAMSPAALFGGTWEQLHDRFLVGAGQLYEEGSYGGSISIDIKKENLPNYAMDLFLDRSSTKLYWDFVTGGGMSIKTARKIGDEYNMHVSNPACVYLGGSEKPIEYVPQYWAVNMWKRVA